MFSLVRKAVFAAVALGLAGSTIVYAQRAASERGDGWRLTAADVSALTDARIAGLKAGLKLSPEQEANWPAFEQAVRDFAKLRAERRAAWFEREHTWFQRDRTDRDGFQRDHADRDGFQRNHADRDGSQRDHADHDRADAGTAASAESPIARLQRRADALSSRGAALRKLADAAAPLYASLDEAQKHRFVVLARDIAPLRQHFAFAEHARVRDNTAEDAGRDNQNSDRMDHGASELR